MIRALTACALLSVAACSQGEKAEVEAPLVPGALAYVIEAGGRTGYDLRCRFTAVQIAGKGAVNNEVIRGSGPKRGFLPTDNARCTLKHDGGEGPVTLTLDKAGARSSATAAPGETTTLNVF